MDPASAIGVAAACIAFLSFSTSLIKNSRDIYKSADGSSTDNAALKASATRLQELHDDLVEAREKTKGGLSADEVAIKEIATKCAATAKELKDVLRTLTAKPHRVGSSVLQAFGSVTKGSKVRELENRLQTLNKELHLHLTAALHNRQSAIMMSLQKIASFQQYTDLEHAQQLDRLRADILTELKSERFNNHNNASYLTEVGKHLVSWQIAATKASKEGSILGSLTFPEMKTREHSIRWKHSATFQWIFESSHASQDLNFLAWLQSGTGHYWITGKAGSGKSTLMKFLYDHPRTQEALETWRDGSELITANYYFWNASKSELQKSLDGLLRSLLFEILKQSPEMMPIALKRRWDSWTPNDMWEFQGWTTDDLLEAFQELILHPSASTKFCFFIDGMDEYQGEPREIAKAITRLGSLPNVKLCLSSRPWNAFEAEFGKNNKFVLQLHEHTYDDIRLYVREMLEKDPMFESMKANDDGYQEAVTALVQKAKGVFFWVFLVVKDLCNNLPNADSVEDFRKRIEEFPPDLEPFFERMLTSIPKFYHDQSAQIFFMVLEAREPLPLLALSHLMQGNQDVFSLEPTPWSKEQLAQELKTLRTRVKARCQDLIDIIETQPMPQRKQFQIGRGNQLFLADFDRNHTSVWNQWSKPVRLEFVHRSVYDFLQSHHTIAILQSRLRSDFSVELQLCVALLSLLKKFPSISIIEDEFIKGDVPAEPYADIIEHILFYANNVKPSSLDAAMALLDHTETTICTRALRDSRDWDYTWETLPYGSMAHAPLLALAIHRGVLPYVTHRLQQGGIDALNFGKVPPLFRALDLRRRMMQPSRVFGDFNLDTNLVNVLLREGAKTDQIYDGKTVWQQFVSDIGNGSTFPESDQRQTCIDILELLLKHGAVVSEAELMVFRQLALDSYFSHGNDQRRLLDICARYETDDLLNAAGKARQPASGTLVGRMNGLIKVVWRRGS